MAEMLSEQPGSSVTSPASRQGVQHEVDYNEEALARMKQQAEWEANYLRKNKDPPVEWPPFLTLFTKFCDLPLEIQYTIWNLTLRPRAVQVYFEDHQEGFFSDAQIPVALKVCKDSRRAVRHLYPLCFGSILSNPQILFNFSLDTLYFDSSVRPWIAHFLVGLTNLERESIQAIAVEDAMEDFYWNHKPFVELPIHLFETAFKQMPAMKEFYISYALDDRWDGHGLPQGDGPIELFEEWTYEMQAYVGHCNPHDDDEDGASDCQEPPGCDHFLEGIDVPHTGPIWAWRPSTLPLDADWLDWDRYGDYLGIPPASRST